MKYQELKEGGQIQLTEGSECAPAGVKTVRADENGLFYYECAEGKHFLDAHIGPGGELLGVSRVEESA